MLPWTFLEKELLVTGIFIDHSFFISIWHKKSLTRSLFLVCPLLGNIYFQYLGNLEESEIASLCTIVWRLAKELYMFRFFIIYLKNHSIVKCVLRCQFFTKFKYLVVPFIYHFFTIDRKNRAVRWLKHIGSRYTYFT